MTQMKYIIVEAGISDVPYIFPEHIDHTLMANLVYGTVLSAGFINFSVDGLQCYGESIGLKIKSRPEDTIIINRCMGVPNDY